MPKNVKEGTLFDFQICILLQNNKLKGGPFGDIKKFSKSRTVPKKIKGLGALGGFRIVSKKWTDQCEDCSLKKRSLL